MTSDSAIAPQSAAFKDNEEQMQALVDDLKAKLKIIAQGGSETARTRHQNKGKLLPRARIEALLDPNSPFFEISALAAYDCYEDDVPCAGVIAGIGIIHQQPRMIVANDATVKGGTYYPLTVKKHLRAQAIAAQCHLPCLYLVDSGGANLPSSRRSVSRQRSLWAHFLQSSANVGSKHSSNFCGHDLHCWRRLCASDVR